MSEAAKAFENVVKLVAGKDRQIREQQAEIEQLWTFVQRVHDECDNDITTGKKEPSMVVPGDMCVWTLRAEAKRLLDGSPQ